MESTKRGKTAKELQGLYEHKGVVVSGNKQQETVTHDNWP
jgi:hypothetical protein